MRYEIRFRTGMNSYRYHVSTPLYLVKGLNPGVSVVCLVLCLSWVRVVFKKIVVGDCCFNYPNSGHLQMLFHNLLDV